MECVPAASSTARRLARVLAGIALVLVVGGGCATETAGTPHPAPAPPPPSAADGSDLGSCQDGVCEVLIEGPVAIPLDARYGVANLRVETVGPDNVTFAMELTRSGRASTSCADERAAGCRGGSLQISGTEPPTVWVDAETGVRATLPALTVDVVRLEPGGAVLRLAHPAAVDETDLAACWDGTCAVRIAGPAAIPLDPQLGLPDGIRVLSIVEETVTLSAAPANGEDISIGCGGQDLGQDLDICPTTYLDGVVESTLVLGGELGFPRVWVEVAAVDGEGVVLQLRPEE